MGGYRTVTEVCREHIDRIESLSPSDELVAALRSAVLDLLRMTRETDTIMQNSV